MEKNIIRNVGNTSIILHTAIEFASLAHQKQTRKGTLIPYIVHPFEVAMILTTIGCNVNVVIAGLLHDTLEDADVNIKEIEDKFGKEVAYLVAKCSEDKTKTWEERKKHTIDELKNETDYNVIMLACADKLSNLRSIKSDYDKVGEKLWERFRRGKDRQQWYYGELVKVLSPLRDTSIYQELVNTFDSLFKPSSLYSNDNVVNKEVKIIGVDGCKGGWAAFIIQCSGYDFEIYNSIQDLCTQHKDAKYIIIDMPIGLPENKQELRPDSLARQILKGKASSVFNCPCRQAIYVKKDRASDANRSILGVGLSQQSIAIIPKIRELDSFLQEHNEYRNILIESHPEVCFAKLNGSPIMEKKRDKEGKEKRLEVLSRYYDLAKEAFCIISEKVSGAQADDIIDAICLAVVGNLSLKSSLKTIPAEPQTDAKGLPMQMVYADPVVYNK